MSQGASLSDAASWRELADDDDRLSAPTEVTTTPVDPLLELLPTNEMSWTNFERLLIRVTREVQGLRSVRLYGTPGQAQQGLDLVGVNAADDVEGVQGKKYQRFSKSNLDKAVKKFLDGTVPFKVRRLAIGVSCRANSTSVTEQLTELNTKHAGDVEFELWDQDRLSEMLRLRPDIVREFFGTATAVRFCGDFQISPHPVAPLDAVGVAEAVMRGPVATSGAQEELAAAERYRDSDPDRAIDHVRTAQEQLREAGFPAHAQVLNKNVTDILMRAGRHSETAGLLAAEVWLALDEDRTDEAAQILRNLKAIAAQIGDASIGMLAEATEVAVDGGCHPLGAPLDESVLTNDVPFNYQVRLYLLAGEIRLAQGQAPFESAAAQAVSRLIDAGPNRDDALSVRLQLCLADSDGQWSDLVRRARRRRLRRGIRELVLARHARFLANRGDFDQAEEDWDDAVEQACLGRYNGDAAGWLYSQRMLTMRYRPPTEDRYHPLASALNAIGGQPPVAGAARSARERALRELHDGQLRAAAIRLQRFLRDSAVSGNWAAETEARNLLADVYERTRDIRLAAHHLILAGNASDAHALGLAAGDNYLDVSEYLDASTYWTIAAAFRLIAAQSDLVPDNDVERIAQRALDVVEQIQSGELTDTPLFMPSAFLSAHEALAALAERLTNAQGKLLLDLLEPLAPVDQPNQYRHTDKSHAIACAGIGRTHAGLARRAVDQLLILLDRAGQDVTGAGRRLIADHLEYSRDELQRQRAAGRIDAGEILAQAVPESIDPTAAEDAAAALMAPTASGPGSYAVGTDAVYRSILARSLPSDWRAELIRHQLERCRSPHESVHNRCDYLLAAANLTEGLAGQDIDELFPDVLSMTRESALSEADETNRMFSHPLGGMYITDLRDDRPAAAFLAARLARTDAQRREARDAALHLIGTSEYADLWSTKALQVLSRDLTADVLPMLAKLNWPQRSLAAIAWAESDDAPPTLGEALAQDSDPRVRRSFAGALATVPTTPRTERARRALASDTRFSVRRALRVTSSIDDDHRARKGRAAAQKSVAKEGAAAAKRSTSKKAVPAKKSVGTRKTKAAANKQQVRANALV